MRPRGTAVRYPSKTDADNDKLLVKANRSLNVEFSCLLPKQHQPHHHDGASFFSVSVVSLQGWRKAMEDEHFVWIRGSSSNDERWVRRFHCNSTNLSASAMHSAHSSPVMNSGAPSAVGSAASSPERGVAAGAAVAAGSGASHAEESSCGAAASAADSGANDPAAHGAMHASFATGSPHACEVDVTVCDPALLPNNAPGEAEHAALLAETDSLAASLPFVEAFVGIFDGHAGDAAPKYLSQQLFKFVLQHVSRAFASPEKDYAALIAAAGSSSSSASSPSSSSNSNGTDDVVRATFLPIFEAAFLECDASLRQFFSSASSSPASPSSPTANGGSTAAGALITRDHVLLFSVGDCRSAVYQLETHADSEFQPIDSSEHHQQDQHQQHNGAAPSSSSSSSPHLHASRILGKLDDDHRPASAVEAARLERIGASVVNGRVGGKLSVSRAFGDFALKPEETADPRLYPVVCLPDVCAVCRHSSKTAPLLVVIGCDGVWETQELSSVGDLVAAAPSVLAGTVRVAQRSVATMQPLSAAGGLLPGSDNVTFATIVVPPPSPAPAPPPAKPVVPAQAVVEARSSSNDDDGNDGDKGKTAENPLQQGSGNEPLITSPKEQPLPGGRCCW